MEKTEKIGLKEDAHIKQSGEMECKQLQKEWGKFGYLCQGDNTR